MRIWDIPPKKLCRNHLLREHRELHAIWTVLSENKKGYSRHPEMLRWKGKLKALYLRHERLVREMKKRKYNHNSILPVKLALGAHRQFKYVDPHVKQIRILKSKKCGCNI